MAVKKPYHHGALREALLAQAFQDLETAGLEGLSLRGLAGSAGVSKTAPYRHFADKRDLLVSLAADGFRMLAETLEAVRPEQNPSGIRALFRAYVEFARARPALYRLMFSRLGYELHSEACRRNSQRALACLQQAVAAAQAAGWRRQQEATSLVLSLWANVHGWATLLIDDILPPGAIARDADWRRFTEALLD